MPPSPRVTATLNEQEYQRVCDELNIINPTVTTRLGSAKRKGYITYGDYNAAVNHINIYIDHRQLEVDGLRHAQAQLAETLLHELRHAWQFQHNRELFAATVAAETDARGWAARMVGKHKTIMRLSRTFPNSGFSRLSRHDRRQAV